MTIFSLSLYLKPWLLPPGLNLLLMLVGFITWYFLPRVGKTITMLGFISLWLLSIPFVAYNLTGFLQDQYPMLQVNSYVKSNLNEAIVVLGGGDTIEAEYGNKQAISDATLHRLNYAAYLHEKTNLPIIVSGGKLNGAVHSCAELMTEYLRDRYKITPIFAEDKSLTTADESKFLAVLLKQYHIHHIYLVTHARHMPRSVYTFQRAGISVTPAPMGYYVYGPGYALISFLPNMDALYASSTAIHEYIGLFWYHLYS